MVSVDPSQMWRNFALIFPYIFFNIVAAYVIPPCGCRTPRLRPRRRRRPSPCWPCTDDATQDLFVLVLPRAQEERDEEEQEGIRSCEQWRDGCSGGWRSTRRRLSNRILAQIIYHSKACCGPPALQSSSLACVNSRSCPHICRDRASSHRPCTVPSCTFVRLASLEPGRRRIAS